MGWRIQRRAFGLNGLRQLAQMVSTRPTPACVRSVTLDHRGARASRNSERKRLLPARLRWSARIARNPPAARATGRPAAHGAEPWIWAPSIKPISISRKLAGLSERIPVTRTTLSSGARASDIQFSTKAPAGACVRRIDTCLAYHTSALHNYQSRMSRAIRPNRQTTRQTIQTIAALPKFIRTCELPPRSLHRFAAKR